MQNLMDIFNDINMTLVYYFLILFKIEFKEEYFFTTFTFYIFKTFL